MPESREAVSYISRSGLGTHIQSAGESIDSYLVMALAMEEHSPPIVCVPRGPRLNWMAGLFV
jgi:hypothetical protein